MSQKNASTHGKVLLLGIPMYNIKNIQKLYARLKSTTETLIYYRKRS